VAFVGRRGQRTPVVPPPSTPTAHAHFHLFSFTVVTGATLLTVADRDEIAACDYYERCIKSSISPIKVGQGMGKKMGIQLWSKWFGEGTSEKENVLTAFLQSAVYCTDRRKLPGILLSIHVIIGNFVGRKKAICHEKMDILA
jgi:hypothetical protein